MLTLLTLTISMNPNTSQTQTLIPTSEIISISATLTIPPSPPLSVPSASLSTQAPPYQLLFREKQTAEGRSGRRWLHVVLCRLHCAACLVSE